MSGNFDPYHRWLGVAPEEQPADHYRLLGLTQFEDDPDVIESAADKQMAHVRSFQLGARAADAQRLLNELAAAKLVLLRPEEKQAYDAQLKSNRATSGEPEIAQPLAATPLPPLPSATAATSAATGKPATTRDPSRPLNSAPLMIGAAALGAVLLAGALFVFKPWKGGKDPAPTDAGSAGPKQALASGNGSAPQVPNIKPPPQRLPANLLETVVPSRHAMQQSWRCRKGEVTAPNAFAALLRIPVVVKGSYELRTEFTRNHGTGLIAVIFPVADRYSSFLLAAGRGQEAIFDGQDQGRVTPSRLKNGRRYTFTIRTLLKGSNANLQILLDGKPYTSWTGPISKLDVDKHRKLPGKGRVGLYSHMASVTFHTLSIRKVGTDGDRVTLAPEAE